MGRQPPCRPTAETHISLESFSLQYNSKSPEEWAVRWTVKSRSIAECIFWALHPSDSANRWRISLRARSLPYLCRSAGCVCRGALEGCNNLRAPCQPSQASQYVSVETLTLTMFDAHRIFLRLLVWYGAKLTNMLSLRRNLTHEAYLR